MKKNGFTLVELLAIIAVLTAIMLLVLPKFSSSVNDRKQKEYNKLIKTIENAGKVYHTYNQEKNKVSINELVKEDLLTSGIKSPIDDTLISGCVFFGKDEKGLNTYTYQKYCNSGGEVILKVDLDGGTMSDNISGGYEPNTEIVLENPTREGYDFLNWEVISDDAVIEGNVLKIGTKNLTLVANWKQAKSVKLSVDLNGGTSKITFKSEYYAKSTINLGTPTKDEYTFAGWKLISGDAVISGSALTFGSTDVSIKATWTGNAKNFEYTGSEQTFTAPLSGRYKLEVWGAQGGSSGGVGGYSIGTYTLTANQKIYINIGGAGGNGVNGAGGYNGGGRGYASAAVCAGGGGATHIATVSGLLSTLSSKKDKILIVAGGGGGYCENGGTGGVGGGIKGGGSNPGTQTGGASFGLGAGVSSGCCMRGGGGGGFYGGSHADNDAGYGGSGYIGNSLLKNKAMYCYNCTSSTAESTKTISTTCANAAATENCAKKGNGYVRITYIGE